MIAPVIEGSATIFSLSAGNTRALSAENYISGDAINKEDGLLNVTRRFYTCITDAMSLLV